MLIRPIFFRPDMLSMIGSGAKTQTRRIIRSQPEIATDGYLRWAPRNGGPNAIYTRNSFLTECPFGGAGAHLWCKESHRAFDDGDVYYKADFRKQDGTYSIPVHADDEPESWRWSPALFMPRWAARVWLEITRVRVERIQEISEDDALAEGVEPKPDAEIAARVAGDSPARMEFYALWESLHGPGAWTQNAWVWVLDFRVTQAVSQAQTGMRS